MPVLLHWNCIHCHDNNLGYPFEVDALLEPPWHWDAAWLYRFVSEPVLHANTQFLFSGDEWEVPAAFAPVLCGDLDSEFPQPILVRSIHSCFHYLGALG